MNKLILIAGGIALWALYQRRATSQELQFTEIYPGEPETETDTTAPSFVDSALELFQPSINNDMDKNRAAFLAMLRSAEGTDQYENPYEIIFGGLTMDGFDFSDHPANLGFTEWAHFTVNGKDNFSTASGAYQFTRATWNRLKTKLSLPDFSPPSQDLGALELIREKGALSDIDAGDAITAARKVSGVWASLPGAPYGQPTRSSEFVATAFNNALATA